ncbi:MAG TPA: hypothetical protein PL124_07190 [Candidatus Cloacimonadota bacterium]|nr:hypothetical protein [Candidatus Cloacimonadota bacterium]
MNEATAMSTIESVFKETVDRNEMYRIEHNPGHDGGLCIEMSGIYNNQFSRAEFNIHHTMMILLDEEIVQHIVRIFIQKFRTARGRISP